MLKQSIPLPNGTLPRPGGQYRMTMHGQDLQNLHDMIHSGIVSLTADNAGIALAGFDADPGMQVSVYQTAAYPPTTTSAPLQYAYMWYSYGLASFRPPSNLVAGSLDFNGTVDVTSIAALKDQYPTAGFLMSATAPCLPTLTTCTAGGFFVDANAYVASNVCGPWYVPYNNSLGFTETAVASSGNGAFSYYTACSSTGGSRTIGFLQGRVIMMYYYSSSQLMYSPLTAYPPARNIAGAATTFINPYVPAYSGDQGAGMGFRQWVFTTVTGGCTACALNGNGGSAAATRVIYLLCDAGQGLRVMQSAGSYPSTTLYTSAATDMKFYQRVPNNDQGLLGVTVAEVAGRTTAYVASTTGAIYSFDIASLSWNNNAYTVYRADSFSSYRGMVQAPRPVPSVGQYCLAPPVDSQSAGSYVVGWPNNYALVNTTTTGATWGTQNAPIYATASFGCYAGFYSVAYSTIACSLSTGWPAIVAPSCLACNATAGSYCPPFSQSAAGVLCPKGYFCAGGSADRVACSAPAGYHCAAGTSSNAMGAGGWTQCASGFTCLGGPSFPVAVKPFNPNNAIFVRLGDGVINYNFNTQPVFLDEFDMSVTPSVLVQSVLLPVSQTGLPAGQNVFSIHPSPSSGGACTPDDCIAGSWTGKPGFLSLSADQRYLTLAGFAAPPNTPLHMLNSSSMRHVIARVDFNGNVDTSTTTVYGDDTSGLVYSITSACTYDGSSFVFTGDYATPVNGNALFVNFQPFGTQVTSLTSVQTFTSPSAITLSNADTLPLQGGGFPFMSNYDGWHQCQYINNQLLISHTWASTQAGATNMNGDLMVPAFTGAATAANLNADFSNRYTWNPYTHGAMGFVFFDNNKHLATCDRWYVINVFNDPTSANCRGSATTTTASYPSVSQPGYGAPSNAGAMPAGGIADALGTCHSMAASRDGKTVWYTTDAPGGYSRVHTMFGWAPGGGNGAPSVNWSPMNNWYYYGVASSGASLYGLVSGATVNSNDNRGGAINAYWWQPLAGQPIYKGTAQTPTNLQASFLAALAAMDPSVLRMTPAASGAANAFDVRCQPGYFGSPLLGVTTLTAAAAANALPNMCAPCSMTAAAASPAANAMLVPVGPWDPAGYTVACKPTWTASSLTFVSPRYQCLTDSAAGGGLAAVTAPGLVCLPGPTVAPSPAATPSPSPSSAPYGTGQYLPQGNVGFTPGNIAALRLSHAAIQKTSFSLAASVFIDEFVAPTDPHAMLVLRQSVPLPNGSSTPPPGQYKLTIHGQDLQNVHDIVHGGLISLAGDLASIVVAGVDAPAGTPQPVLTKSTLVGSPYTWTINGMQSQNPKNNLVVGHVDYNGKVDISTTAALAGQANTAALAYSSTAPCTPTLPSCSGNGYLINTDAYFPGTGTCGPWWVPYHNMFGYTQTSTTSVGIGSMSMTGCSSIGAGKAMHIVQNKLSYLYYYSSNTFTVNPTSQWPPSRPPSTGTVGVANVYTPDVSNVYNSQTAMGFRQYVYTTVIGGCQACATPPNTFSSKPDQVYILNADVGSGLRVITNSQTAKNFAVTTASTYAFAAGNPLSTGDINFFQRVPNNDQALIGVMVQTVAGRTTAYVSSQTGNIYSFDVSSLTWNNNGFPVYKGGRDASYRGMVSAPRPLNVVGSYCQSPPLDSQTTGASPTSGGYTSNWPNGFLLAGTTTTGTTWGTQNAPTFASASFGCYAGNYSAAYATITCTLALGWGIVTPPTCLPCSAAAGSYCPPNSLSAAGVPCTQGYFCAGGAADRVPCSAPAGYYCAAGATRNAAGAGGWTLCAAGFTCLGASTGPIAVKPFNPNNAIVVRLGDGVIDYGDNTNPVFLDEYDMAVVPSVLVQSVLLPVSQTGLPAGQNVFSLHSSPNTPNGYSGKPGFLSLSADQRFLTLAGFAAPPNTPRASLYGTSVQRVIARIDWNGNVDTSTTTVYGDATPIAYSITSACTYDGSSFVFTGDYNVTVNGKALLVNFQPFGTQVASLAAVQAFTSPSAITLSASATSPGPGGGYPITSEYDGWHQCQYVDNQLLISHTWAATGGVTNANGDLMVPDFTGAATAANLNADFSNRYTWSTLLQGAMGYAFFDGGHRLAVCDRFFSIGTFNDRLATRAKGIVIGANTYTSGFYAKAGYDGENSMPPPDGGIPDANLQCHSMAASRDGSQVWFTVDSLGGFSRVFQMVGWGKDGAGATANTFYTPTNDWQILNPTYSFVNTIDNFGGVINTFWNDNSPAQPSLKGIALAPTFGAVCGPGAFLNAAAGGQCTLCAANTFSAAANSASCAACPAGASAPPGSTSCACSGAYATFLPGVNSCFTSATPSNTATPSSTASLSGTPSTTPSLSSSVTPSITPTQTPTQTPSNTATTTPTPSVTPIADTVLIFSFSFVPTDGSVIYAANLAQNSAMLAQIAASIAQTMAVPASTVRVMNITDLATNAVVRVSSTTSRRRNLPTAGSAGVSFTLAVNLGKAVSPAQMQAQTQALVANFNATSPAFASVRASVAAATGIAPANLKGAPPAADSLQFGGPGAGALSGFNIAAPSATDGAALTASSAITGAIVGVVLLLAFAGFFVWRSYKLYGRAPWQVDVRREQFELKNRAAREAEERFHEDTVPMTLNPLDADQGPKSQALTLRVPKAAAKEIEALRSKDEAQRAELEAARAEAKRVREEIALLRAGAAASASAKAADASTSFAPVPVGGAAPAAAPAGAWKEVKDPMSGRPYWFNEATRATSWDRPAGL